MKLKVGVERNFIWNDWERAARDHDGEVPVRGSGNYASDEAKEIAR